MIIILKNNQTLNLEEFNFRCCIGKKGKTFNKKEGDLKTPKGIFELGNLYFRADREFKPKTKIKCIKINKDTVCCNEPKNKKSYNRILKKQLNIKHETLFRKDHKYDFVLPIKYNSKNIKGKGSCIFIHLTNNYNGTAGCVALERKDFLILLRMIDAKTKIIIN
jgi:L,D-peptidoglycan transpeptidase YkuD (ErfK/YbiS/YcfS/YnhG family)